MPTPGKNYVGQKGYPTPEVTPETSACRTFRIPASDDWLGVLMGALLPLREEYNWYQWGTMTPQEAADAWNEIILQAYADSFTDTCAALMYPTPFWDDATDVDDDLPSETQPWYGYVTDLDNPTTTFVEEAAIWTFAGVLAVAGTPAAAIAFTTIAPAFVVAIRRGELGEVIRLYLDGELADTVDTSAMTEGDLVRVTLAGDPDLSSHDFLLVKAE